MNQFNSSLVFYIWSDGGARGNPGPAATGFVIKDSSHQLLHSDCRYLGKATNNVAEYTAALDALEYFCTHILPQTKSKKIIFYLDSLLIVKQLRGDYRIKNQTLFQLASKIFSLTSQHQLSITYTHIPREKNSQADSLVNLALDQAKS